VFEAASDLPGRRVAHGLPRLVEVRDQIHAPSSDRTAGTRAPYREAR
jgi:hypothetical protein